MFGLLSCRLNQCRGSQERLSEIVTPRYLAEGTDSKTVSWYVSGLDGNLAFVLCRTWHLDGLKLTSIVFSIFLGCEGHFAE